MRTTVFTLEQIKKLNENFFRHIALLNTKINQNNTVLKEKLLEEFIFLQCQVTALEQILKAEFDQTAYNQKKIATLEEQIGEMKEAALELICPCFKEINLSSLSDDRFDQMSDVKEQLLILLHDSKYQYQLIMIQLKVAAEILEQQSIEDVDKSFDMDSQSFKIQGSERGPAFFSYFNMSRSIRGATSPANTSEVAYSETSSESMEASISNASPHFLNQLKQRGIIPTKKPSFLRFDKKRAYALLQTPEAEAVMKSIQENEAHLAELGVQEVNVLQFSPFNPLVAKQTEVVSLNAFSEWFHHHLSPYTTERYMWQQEIQRVENAKPFFFVRFLYGTTKKVINLWQYELLQQQMLSIQQEMKQCQHQLSNFKTWLRQLSLGSLEQSLSVAYKNALLQIFYHYQKKLEEEYQELLSSKQIHPVYQTNEIPEKTDGSTIAHQININQNLIQEILHSSIGTQTGLWLQAPIAEKQKNKEEWKATFVLGNPLPQAIHLSLLQEIEGDYFSKHADFVHALQNRLCNEIKQLSLKSEVELAQVNIFLLQATEILIQLKRDSLLARIKNCIDQLPFIEQQQTPIVDCVKKIGYTMQERLAKVNTMFDENNKKMHQLIDKIESAISVNHVLQRYGRQLIDLAQTETWSSVQTLEETHQEIVNYLIHFPTSKGTSFAAREVLEYIVLLSKRYQQKKIFQEYQEKMMGLLARDEYFHENILPLPPIVTILPYQQNTITMRRNHHA